VRGARTHNLRNLTLDLPRGRLVVFTGPSGSGKSSLAFDTIFAEGQRRFLATLPDLPPMAVLRPPPVDAVEGLPPVLSVAQRAGTPRPRSTLATLTEIHDHLRLLWARLGTPYCPACDLPIRKHSLAEIARAVLALTEGTKLYVLAPMAENEVGAHKETFKKIRTGGFLRARIDGVLSEIRDIPTIDVKKPHTIDLVVDRLVVRPGIADRLNETLAAAVKQGDGRVVISDIETGEWNDRVYSTKLQCRRCRKILADLEPRRFHFNNPHGACPRCAGLGVIVTESDDDAEEESVAVCLECGGVRLNREARAVRYGGMSLPDVTSQTVLAALDRFRAAATIENPASPLAKVESILRHEITTRLHFLGEVGLGYLTLDRPAPTLSGGELQRARLATQLGGGLRGVCYILDEPTLGLHPRDTKRLLEALDVLLKRGNSLLVVEHDEAVMRAADWLVDLGPEAGKNGGRLLAAGPVDEVMKSTESVTAPYLRGDVGLSPSLPGFAGGGRGEGGQYPSPKLESTVGALSPLTPLTPVPSPPAKPGGEGGQALVLRGAREHNLRGIDVTIPLGRFVAVSGVSGSGKSSLVHGLIARIVRRHLGLKSPPPGPYDSIEGLDLIDKAIEVDQRSLGRSSRSSAATYTGLFDEIRKLYARTRTAKIRGYKANRFSFNVRGGRCETCHGQGQIQPGGDFLPELTVPCPECGGSRFNAATLEVRFKGRSIAEVLAMDVAEARELFAAVPSCRRLLDALADVGLGYLTLGQSASRLSGGEAQRVKLATELARASTGRTLYLLDEPTSGLHRIDVSRLLAVLRRLVSEGNTVLVIEHHLDVIAAADCVIDLGPGAGEEGGRLVVTGTPAEVAACAESVTGRFLAS
jgi:excinuclease ABC subunit A